MMNILHLTVLDEAELWHGLVLVGALFLASILSQLLFMASTTIAHVAGKILALWGLRENRTLIYVALFRKHIRKMSNAKWLVPYSAFG